MRCPGEEVLRAFVELDLEARAEREVRAHLHDCRGCDAAVGRLDPSWVFARLPRRTLADGEWQEVLRAVRAEVAAAPRRSWRHRMAAWLRPVWLLPATAAVAAVVLVAVQRVGPPATPVAGEAEIAADEPAVSGFAAGSTASAVGSSFVYRSNPLAHVAEISLAGDGTEPVRITMVVDETLADLF